MRISWPKFLILIVMSIVGITASSMVLYLYDMLHQQLPACSIPQKFFGITIDCNTVLGSKYNSVYGINLDVLAVAYFIVSLGLVCVVAFGSEWLYTRALRTLFAWRFLGLIIVPYLMIIEFIVLKTVCLYCTTMHIAILVDFAIITYFLFYKKDIKTFVYSAKETSTSPAPTTLQADQ